MTGLFKPILAGATIRDRAVACVGAVFGIGLAGLIAHLVIRGEPQLSLILTAPMGAAAVILFAVPSSPLAQPWSIIGGNMISALTGIAVSHVISDPVIGGAVAVGLAIAVMSLTRCLHPPGGAMALIGVVGGPAVASHGYMFALMPVAFNAITLTAAGWLFHRVSGHTYPHVPRPTAEPAPVATVALTDADIDRALAAYGEPVDIDREDLKVLLNLATDRSAVTARP
jgi:CBS domain-containing membrane protein